MEIFNFGKKICIRLSLIIIFLPFQSCSNTLIGDKLENSFDLIDNQAITEGLSKEKINKKEIKKIKLNTIVEKKIDMKKITNKKLKPIKERRISKSSESSKKEIFNPQPYRIILKLSGANPSAPAEMVTKALRKAGVKFEVEKIERFDQKNLIKNTSSKR